MGFVNSKRGFSLVSVMIASVLVGVLAIGVSKLIVGANQSQAQLQRNSDYTILVSSINSIVSKQELCAKAFKAAGGVDIDMNSSATDVILPAIGGDPASIGYSLESLWFDQSRILSNGELVAPGLTITALGLVPTTTVPDPLTIETAVPGDPAEKTYQRAFVSLFVKAEKSAGVGGLAKKFEKNFPLEILFKPLDGKIATCSMEGSFFAAVNCDPGSVVVGFGPTGPVCEDMSEHPGDNTSAPFSQDLPPGYEAVTCSSNHGNRSINHTCTGKKFKCEFDGGWKLKKIKNNKVVRECGNGVTAVLSETQTTVAKKEGLPSEVSTTSHDISCVRNAQSSVECNNIGLQSTPAKGDCHQHPKNKTWMVVTKLKKNGKPINKVCAGGMRAVGK